MYAPNIEDLRQWYVNVYRKYHGTNAGLWTRDIEAMTPAQLQEKIDALEEAIKERDQN